MCSTALFWCDMGPQCFSSSIQLFFLKNVSKNQNATSYFPCLYSPEGRASSSLSVINTQLLLSMILGISEVCNIKAGTRGCVCMQLPRAVLHTTKRRVAFFISLKKTHFLLVRVIAAAQTTRVCLSACLFACTWADTCCMWPYTHMVCVCTQTVSEPYNFLTNI